MTMPGRPKIFDDEEVIRKARTVFWAKGYEAACTLDLMDAMGIGKGSFYLAFKGGKEELFEKVLEQYSREQIARFRADLEHCENPIEGLKDLFRSIATTSKKTHQNGCIYGNTLAELSNSNVILKDKAINLLQRLEKLFVDVIRQEQKNGRLKNQEDPMLLARNLIALWNGLGITRKMYPDNKVLSGIIEMQLQFLQ